MKEFHRNHVIRSTELEKKGRERRVKKENKDVCKCFAPFVRLHYYGCPAVRKSCPIHGNHRQPGVRDEKNMIISFHPSSKTERLFQPVKTLLAQCAPETKVNLQYYSPKSTASKESIRHQQIQTKWEDEKRALNESVFVEKTKSFVADKTNKMKKLKQCFHSPCNSIVHKSRSQTSVREKFKEIFCEERKKINELENMTPEMPPDDLTWFSNNLTFKDWEKLSSEKTDSDFLTVTHQTKNNLINHKIFEIKHKKGMNDYPFFKLPEQSSQLVYSTLGFKRHLKNTRVSSKRQERRPFFQNSPPSEGSQEQSSKQRREEELSSSENLHTSSSSSVFFTPYILVPAVAEGKSKDRSSLGEENVEVGRKGHGDGKKTSVAQDTQTPSMQSEKELSVSFARESKTASVLMQTDADRHSGGSVTPEWYTRPLEVAESFTTRGTQTDESLFRLDKCVGDSTRLSELSSTYFAPVSTNQFCDYQVQGTQTSASPTDSQASGSRGAEAQTTSRRREKGPVKATTVTMTTVDKVVQTETGVEMKRLWSFKMSKSHTSPKVSNKTTRSESLEEVSEFLDLNSSNVTFVVKPFDNQESDQAIDKVSKAWWGKSHSDSQLYVSEKCSCQKAEYVIPFPQSCSCNQSESARDSTKRDQSRTESCSSKEAKVLTARNKADKSLGANDGSQRSYRRAEKALGTDSRVGIPPEVLGKADKALGTDSGIIQMNRKVDKALGTENEVPSSSRKSPAKGSKANNSPRKAECSCKTEQTFGKEECFPNTPLSDLSELTKIIQEFFEKTNKTTWKTCPCESSGVAEKKTEKTTTADSKKGKKESVDHAVGTQTVHEKKVEAMPDAQKKTKREFSNAGTEEASSGQGVAERPGNHAQTDRVKIRRSVLLDDNERKTRFVCSVCAREISTFSTNVATNTECLRTSPRAKEKVPSVSAEVRELIKVKTLRTVQSFDNPKRLTSAPEPTARGQGSDSKEEPPQPTSRPQRDSSKSYIPTPRPVVTINERNSQTAKKTTSTPRGCICEHEDDVCTTASCSRRYVNTTAPMTSKASPPPKTEHQSSVSRSDRPRTSQTKNGKTAAEKSRTHRRALDPFYPVIVKSMWPREFAWNMAEKSHSSIPEDWEGEALQKKRTYERETPGGKKSKPEFEKEYFVLGSATSQELQMGDRIVFPNKAGFILIPSLSTSSIDHAKKHGRSVIKSEEKVQEPNELQGAVLPEGLNEPPDLSSTKSCRLAPLRVECDDKLFECRVCKSLTFVKTDRDGLVFHWRHGLLTCRPTAMQQQNPTAWRGRRDDSESVQRNGSSTQNLEELFEESSHFTDRSDSPSPYELLPEEVGETSEEESDSRPDLRRRSNEASVKVSDIFYSNAPVSSKSISKFWPEGYPKKE